MMQKLLAWLRSFFRRPAVREELAATTASIPVEVTAPIPVPVKRVRHASFRRDVLGQLKLYMRYIKRMKKHDKEAYNIYSKLGAQIVPYDMAAEWTELDPWFRETLPSFGAIAYAQDRIDKDEQKGKVIYPKFVYFMKMARAPHNVQQMNNGAIYQLTAFFADARDEKLTFAADMFVVVSDGDVRPLLTLVEARQTIQHKSGERGVSHVATTRWGIPPILKQWASENGKSPTELARELFFSTASFFTQAANTTIRVEAREHHTAAVFVVDVLRTPQFFADREKVKTAGGRTAPIFHIVRPHTRTLPSGKKIAIKAHFSGLSDFKWNGYAIKITVPGKDHASLADADFGAYDEETAREAGLRDTVTVEEVADRLQGKLQRKRAR